MIDHLVRHLEDLAAAHRIEYLKIMNAELVCASGFDDNPDHGVQVLADVALDLQERCVRLFADIHTRMEFRLGIDTGVVIGSAVGREEGSYNLWGEAVRAAQWMAETSMAGGIQATASTYRHLRDSYLFTVRGTYYLQDVGEISTYTLGLTSLTLLDFLESVLTAMGPKEYALVPLKTLAIGFAIGLISCTTGLAVGRVVPEVAALLPRGFVKAVLATLLISGGLTMLL